MSENKEENRLTAARIARVGLFSALAMIFGYLEMLIPVQPGIPGIKLGLANIIIVISMYLFSTGEVVFILIVRNVLSGFLFGNVVTLIYCLAGGFLSFLGMYFAKRTRLFSIVGVSATGGVLHNVGQLLVALILINNNAVLYYLPVLLISGSISGVVIGFISKLILPRIKFRQ